MLKKLFYGICFSAAVFLSTCGLEELYFLPQVPEINIRPEFNTSATINLPPLTEYYAQNYTIFYRIYISGNSESGTINTSSLRNSINPSLESDFNAIYPNTDPTTSTAGTPAGTLFKNRNYFQLELQGENIANILSINGGNVRISFPTIQGSYPVMSINNGTEYRLFRSKELISPLPDRYFRNRAELNAPENANSNANADVVGVSGLSRRYAYVSMYIVAVGINDEFTSIYSKPTHISIFKLPDF